MGLNKLRTFTTRMGAQLSLFLLILFQINYNAQGVGSPRPAIIQIHNDCHLGDLPCSSGRSKRSSGTPLRVFKYLQIENKSNSSGPGSSPSTEKPNSLIPNKFYSLPSTTQNPGWSRSTVKDSESQESAPQPVRTPLDVNRMLKYNASNLREPLYGPPPPPPPPPPPLIPSPAPLTGLNTLPSPQAFSSSRIEMYEPEFDAEMDHYGEETMSHLLPVSFGHRQRHPTGHSYFNYNHQRRSRPLHGYEHSRRSHPPLPPLPGRKGHTFTNHHHVSRHPPGPRRGADHAPPYIGRHHHKTNRPVPSFHHRRTPPPQRNSIGHHSKLHPGRKHRQRPPPRVALPLMKGGSRERGHGSHSRSHGPSHRPPPPPPRSRFPSFMSRSRNKPPPRPNHHPSQSQQHNQGEAPYRYPKNAANIQDIINHFDQNEIKPGLDDGAGLSKELGDVHTSLLKDIRQFAQRPQIMNEYNKPPPRPIHRGQSSKADKTTHYGRTPQYNAHLKGGDVTEEDYDPYRPPGPLPVRSLGDPGRYKYRGGGSGEETSEEERVREFREEEARLKRLRERVKAKEREKAAKERELEMEAKREKEWERVKSKTRDTTPYYRGHGESKENYMDELGPYGSKPPYVSSEEYFFDSPENYAGSPSKKSSTKSKGASKGYSKGDYYTRRERKRPYKSQDSSSSEEEYKYRGERPNPILLKRPYEDFDVATKRYASESGHSDSYPSHTEPEPVPIVEIHTGPAPAPSTTQDKTWERLYMEYLLSQQQKSQPPPRPIHPPPSSHSGHGQESQKSRSSSPGGTSKPMRMKIHIYPNGESSASSINSQIIESNDPNSSNIRSGQSPPLYMDKPVYDFGSYSSQTVVNPPGHYHLPSNKIRVTGGSPTSKGSGGEKDKKAGMILHLHVHSNGRSSDANRRSDSGGVEFVDVKRSPLYDGTSNKEDGMKTSGSGSGSSNIYYTSTAPSKNKFKNYDEEEYVNEEEGGSPNDLQNHYSYEVDPPPHDKSISMELPVKGDKLHDALLNLLNLREP